MAFSGILRPRVCIIGGILAHSSAASFGFSEETRSEGYDEFFDPPLESKYECPICLLGLRDPVQTSCGHRFCRECIKRSLRDAGHKCPVDNEPLLETQLYPDNFAKREIMAITVCCRFKKVQGCQWKGTLNDLQAHLDGCPFAEVVCPNYCGQAVQRQELPQHETECDKRVVTCEHCGGRVLASNFEEHLRRCPKIPLQCENCQISGIPRDKMSEHLQKICPNVRSKCPLAVVGCPFEGLRQEVNDHVKKELLNLVSDLANYFLERKQHQQQQQQSGASSHESTAPTVSSRTRSFESRPREHFGGSADLSYLREEIQRIRREADELRRLVNERASLLAVRESQQEYIYTREWHQRQQPRSGAVRYESLVPGAAALGASPARSDQRPSRELRDLVDDQLVDLVRQINELSERGPNSQGHDLQIQALTQRVLRMETKMIEYEGRVCNGTYIWRIENFRQRRQDAVSNVMTAIHSPPFYTSLHGYKMCMRVNLNGFDSGLGRHVSLFVHMMQGDWDGILRWPFTGLITFSILDQSENCEFRRDICETLVAKPNLAAFQKPTSPVNRTGYGYVDFAPVEQLREPKYVKDNVMLIRIQVSLM